MKQKILERLQTSIKGEVLFEEEFRNIYSVDSSSYQIIPKIIVIPKNELDVINAIKIAKKFKISITARGGGTGLVGGALNKGIILDMRNFQTCSVKKNYVKVGSGISKGQIDKALETERKFFPPNPSVGSFCKIGGMIGNNSSGSRSLKYGSVIDNILEITFVDGKGKKITLPKDKKTSKKILDISKKIDKLKFPQVSKNSSGYRIDKIDSIKDAHKIIAGSEGTLGVVLSAKLKIADKPVEKFLSIIGYKTYDDAFKECIKLTRMNPSAMEFVDKTTLKQIKYNFNESLNCLLFVEFDNKITSNEKKLPSKLTKGTLVFQTKKDLEINQWWRYRDSSLHYSLKSIKSENLIPHIIEDAVVPVKNVRKILTILKKINRKYKTKAILYGHVGNGNLHVRLIGDRNDLRKIKETSTEYFAEILKIGGVITAEHGDGFARSEFIKRQYGSKNYKVFKEIKNYFDPFEIMNPNKIISKKSTIIQNLHYV